MTKYAMTLETLKNMDEKQMIEMFHDIGDLKVVERIADTAYHFVENYVDPEEDEATNEKSDYEDWKEQDDAQRYADIKSTQDSYR